MKITIIGLGAYGIALARVFHENDNRVVMYTKFKDEADIVSLKRENINVFKGVKIPKEIEISTDLEQSLENSKIIVLAVPMNAVRTVSSEISKYLTEDQVVCIVSKGIEPNTNKLMSQVVFEETESENICMISGPSFAIETYADNEIGLIVASESLSAQATVKVCLENSRISVNVTKDIIGVQLAATTKNIFAIILGMLDGMKKSDSTRAAILTCLVNDMRMVIELLGGKSQTAFTYAGLGDILLTCMSSKSRNYTFGKYLGEGLSKDEALKKMKTKTVEGLYSLKSIYDMLKDIEVEIKSIEMIYNVIFENIKVDNVLRYIKR